MKKNLLKCQQLLRNNLKTCHLKYSFLQIMSLLQKTLLKNICLSEFRVKSLNQYLRRFSLIRFENSMILTNDTNSASSITSFQKTTAIPVYSALFTSFKTSCKSTTVSSPTEYPQTMTFPKICVISSTLLATQIPLHPPLIQFESKAKR